jgi:glutaminyl-peptide cyclotransferase
MKIRTVRGVFQTTVLFLCLGAGCDRHPPTPAPAPVPPPAPVASSPAQTQAQPQDRPPGGQVWRYSYQIVNTFPHDRDAFTQGLVFLDGKLFESTGLIGQSSLREVDLASGRVLREVQVSGNYFAEGLALLGGKAYQLTWQAQKGFVYDAATFRLEREFAYSGEGWGLATDGHWLIMSDGTAQIRFLDPSTFKVARTIQVAMAGKPVSQLNELEYIKGEIFANVWKTDDVVRIDPIGGGVTGVINFSGLLPPADYDAHTDVLNGIAHDDATDRLFITGKCWPKLFEVRLRRLP